MTEAALRPADVSQDPRESTRSSRGDLLVVLLGVPGPQRLHTAVSLMGVIVYCVFAAIQSFEVANGLIDPGESAFLTRLDITVGLLFFLLARTGLNTKFKVDPSLAFSQCAFALISTSISYAITGPARGAVLGIVLIILVFAMFSLSIAQIRLLSLIAFVVLTSVMLWRSQTSPTRYPAAVEATHAMFALIIIASSAVLSARMVALRRHMASQRTELSKALELNRRLATLDELTGLINRRQMTAILHSELERQRRNAGSMSVALIDVDHFKRVNDRYGHATGDSVLQGFATVALEQLRACDVISRWGGEEFLLLMPDIDQVAAMAAINRLRVAFANRHWPAAPGLRTTFSAGVATRQEDEPVEALVERADQCMYAAKSSGRDRVCDTDVDSTLRSVTQSLQTRLDLH